VEHDGEASVAGLVELAERLAGAEVSIAEVSMAEVGRAQAVTRLRSAAGDDVEALVAAEHRLRDLVESGRADGPLPGQAADLLDVAACRAALAHGTSGVGPA